MAKSVTYSIELLDSPGNVGRLKSIADHASQLDARLKRIGSDFGSSIEVGVARAEAAMNRFNELSKKGAFHEIGMGPRVGEPSRFDIQPTRSPQQQLGPRSSGTMSIDQLGGEPPRKSKTATADTPDYATQLESISKLGDELNRVGETSKRAKKDVESIGSSGSGLDDVIGTFGDFETRLSQIDKEAEKAGKTFDRSGKQIRTSMSEGVEGVSRFVQGLSLLGLRNSETAAQLLDGILVIKGIGDTVVGATKIYSQFSDMIEATKRRQDSGNRSTELAAERHKLASAAAEKLSRSLREEAQVAGRLDDVHDEQSRSLRKLADELDHAAASARGLDHAQDNLNHNDSPGGRGAKGRTSRGRGRGAAVAGVVGAIGSQFVGDAIGGLGFGDAATGAASIGADAGMDALIYRFGALGGRGATIGGAGAAGSSALGGAAATIGAIAIPAAAAASALGAVALVGKEVHEIYSGTANQVGSVTDTIASWEVGLVSSVGELTGAFDLVGNAATKRAQADFEAAKRVNEMNDQIRTVKMDAGYDMRQKLGANRATFADLDTTVATVGKTGPAREFAELSARSASSFAEQSRSAKELATQLKIARGDMFGTADDIAKANGRVEEQSGRIIQLGREQISLVEQEARLRIGGVDTYIQKLGEGKRTAEDTIKTLRDGLITGAERFAQLGDDEQQFAIQASRKASFDPTSLDDKERSALRSIGTQDATRAARQADLAEAKSKGFDKFFGQSERTQINSAQQQAQQIDFKIQVATQFKVEIQAREQQIVAALAGQVRSVVDASNQRIIEQTQKLVSESEARIRATFATTNTVKRN